MTTILVTGATGLTGSNVCRRLIERGDHVRALVRTVEAAQPLADLGAELVTGDVTDPAATLAAAKGADAAIHTAALLGGASQDLAEFEAVNFVGTVNVLEAARAHGLRRVVALSTGTFFDRSTDAELEDAPLLANPPEDPYTVSKLAAFRAVQERVSAGQDVLTCHPGAIFGAGPIVDRALAPTTFNRIILAALRGRLRRSLDYPVSWVTGDDVAGGAIAALDNGEPGERYWLVGREEDRVSTAQMCNRALAIAGLPHVVQGVDPLAEPSTIAADFGPTLAAVAAAAARERYRPRPAVSKTSKRIGYSASRLDDGLADFVHWLRVAGRLA